jgi:hypothetical protein
VRWKRIHRRDSPARAAVSQPTPLTAVPAPAAEVVSTVDEPTATTTATDGAPPTTDHAAASARRSTTSRTATTKSAGRSTPRALAFSQPTPAHALVQMGGSANLAAAIALYDRIIEIMGADHPEAATTLYKKAHALVQMGGSANHAAAIALYYRVIEIKTAAAGADHPQTATTLYKKAHALVQMNGSANHAAAIALYDLATAALGADHLEAAATLHQAESHPTPLTAVPAPAAEVVSTMDEPTATTTATDGAPPTTDHAAASARRSTTSRTATTKSAGRSTPRALAFSQPTPTQARRRDVDASPSASLGAKKKTMTKKRGEHGPTRICGVRSEVSGLACRILVVEGGVCRHHG